MITQKSEVYLALCRQIKKPLSIVPATRISSLGRRHFSNDCGEVYKIKKMSVYQCDLLLKEGSYSWSSGKSVSNSLNNNASHNLHKNKNRASNLIAIES